MPLPRHGGGRRAPACCKGPSRKSGLWFLWYLGTVSRREGNKDAGVERPARRYCLAACQGAAAFAFFCRTERGDSGAAERPRGSFVCGKGARRAAYRNGHRPLSAGGAPGTAGGFLRLSERKEKPGFVASPSSFRFELWHRREGTVLSARTPSVAVRVVLLRFPAVFLLL
uniref:Uncharacterized protein n=1 Tax=Macaca mulatta TaxID=9544 RepID=A0A5F8A8Q0_MACMU